jgi:hypothetical protein
MCRSHASRLFLSCLVAWVAMACSFAPSGPAETPKEIVPERSVYHTDAEHLWNRLHRALFVRMGPDGHLYGQDRLEPLLWPVSMHLLEKQSRKRAVTLLEEFLKERGEKLIEDPLRRALLQRDLWLVFNWLEDNHGPFEDPVMPPEEMRAAVEQLRRPLTAVIRRLALTPEQIEKVPDNYAVAVRSGAFARHFDPEQPDKPYLPNLFAPEGAWVCVGRPDGPIAPEHLRESGNNVFTNSAFLLFLRLPADRAATLDYLARLRAFDQPLLIKVKAPGNRSDEYLPNPKLPRFPVGTEAALVRRALLIDSAHKVRPTALTESVQLRVYREVPEMTVQTLDAALVGGTSANRRAQRWQSFQEFRLSRALLFAGRAGGLHSVGTEERDFETGFGSHSFDEFEFRGYRPAGRSFAEVSQGAIKEKCFACHSLPGVSSFNSFFHYRVNLRPSDGQRPFSLREMSVVEVSGAAVKWKQGRPNWTALRKLLAE